MPSLAMYEENMLSLSVSNLRSLKGIHLWVCKTDRYSMAEQHCRLLTADIEHGILNLYRDRASEDQKLSINLKCFSLTILYHSTVSPTFIFRFRIWRYNGRVVTLLSDKRCNRNISSWWHFDDCQQETGEVSVMDIQVYGSPRLFFAFWKDCFLMHDQTGYKALLLAIDEVKQQGNCWIYEFHLVYSVWYSFLSYHLLVITLLFTRPSFLTEIETCQYSYILVYYYLLIY